MSKQKQAVAPKTIKMGNDAFEKSDVTKIYWLGNSGTLINSRGTTIMIDPLLKGFDMPLLIDMPMLPSEVPHLDALLITHIDNDHFSRVSIQEMEKVTKSFYAPNYVANVMKEELEIDATGHDIHDKFSVGNVEITVTPADHAWQNDYPGKYGRVFDFEDYCGYYIETLDGTIWCVGDSRLLEEQLKMPAPDYMLFDFSDNDWHIGFDNAVKLANNYPKAKLILVHWGSVDAPEVSAFNGDPQRLKESIINPERALVVAAGEEIIL